MPLRHALIAALVVAASLCRAAGETAPNLVERVKAAFLYKFTGYVQWPSEAYSTPESPLVFAIAGSATVAEELEQAVAGRRQGDRPITVRRLGRDESSCEGCQVLFVGREVRPARAAALLDWTRGKPILTVTEEEGEQPRGSVIHFVVEDRVRFDISREAGERNGLRLSSSLLSVARHVTTRAP